MKPAEETVFWELWEPEEEKAGGERGVRVSDGRGDAKGPELPERV